MSVAISWANKMQLAKCDIMVGSPISSHIAVVLAIMNSDTQTSYLIIKKLVLNMFLSYHQISN